LTEADRGRGRVRNRIGLRPVVPGARGNWVRTGISWSTVGYVRHGQSADEVRPGRLLREILALYTSEGAYYSYGNSVPYLDEAPSRRIWDLLAEAEEIGMPLV